MAKSNKVKAFEPKVAADFAADPRFIEYVKQYSISVAEKDPDISTGRAAGLITSVDEETVREVIAECELDAEPIHPEPEDGQEAPAVRGPLQNLFQFIKNVDPEKIAAAAQLILKFLGLKIG